MVSRTSNLTPTAIGTRPKLSVRCARTGSSAIRDLLDQAKRPGMISLAGGLPDSSLFPVDELSIAADHVLSSEGRSALQYGITQGDEAARQGLTALFEGETSASDLVITTGSQQALDLITRVLLDPGDTVAVADPAYLGALQVFRAAGADLCPIAIDQDGLNTDQLEDELKWGVRPKLVYLVPHFQNPTGVSTTVERRRHLFELASRYGFVVVEDDPYRELYFDGAVPQHVIGDPALTVRLRSISKTLAPGLRVGALAGPRWLIEPVITAKQSADLHTSSLTQAIASRSVLAPWYRDHLARLRSAYGAKRDELCRALRASFGDDVDFATPSGGMFLWAGFDQVGDSEAWLVRALDVGVCFVPGPAFSINRDLSSQVRLSYATSSAVELREAVDRLASSM